MDTQLEANTILYTISPDNAYLPDTAKTELYARIRWR